jgi:hypothetical protein
MGVLVALSFNTLSRRISYKYLLIIEITMNIKMALFYIPQRSEKFHAISKLNNGKNNITK